ncbi:MAG: MMPL family transporter [Candidatus Bipolaricaulis sp.]|nr:MMPL family transporter [Candidatus Bipolaricaulis sp.]
MKSRSNALWRPLFRLVRYRTWWVVLAAVGIAVFAYLYTLNVPLRSSYFELLPRNDPLILEYEENQIYLSTSDSVVLLVSLREPEGLAVAERQAALLRAAEGVAAALRLDPEIETVTYTVEPSPDIPDQYVLLYQLGPERLAGVESSLDLARSSLGQAEAGVPADADLVAAYRAVGELIDTAATSGISVSGAEIPSLADFVALNRAVLYGLGGLNSFPAVTDAVNQVADLFAPQEQVARVGQALFSRDRTRLLVSAKPRQSAQLSVGYCQHVRDSVFRDLETVDLDALGVRVEATGAYMIMAETEETVNADMHRTELITAAGVLLVFLVSFGSLLYSLVAAVPLLLALVLTSAWTKAGLGGFNLITTFVPSLILGMGDDFAIHLIARFTEERMRGASFTRSLYTMLTRKGAAIFLGAGTIVLVFLSLLTARSRALFEMGVIASVGIALAFLCAIVLIPTLLTANQRLRKRRRCRERRSAQLPHFAAFFRAITHPIGATVLVGVLLLLTGGAVYLASGVRFEFSSTDLVPRTPSQAALSTILGAFDLGGDNAQLGTNFLFFAQSEAEMADLVEKLRAQPVVLSVSSPQDYLPTNLAEQQAALRGLRLSQYADQLAAFRRVLSERNAVLGEMRTLLTRLSLVEYAATANGWVRLGLDAAMAQTQLLEIRRQLTELSDDAQSRVEDLEIAIRSLDARLAEVRDLPPAETLLRDIIRSLPAELATQYLTVDGRYIVRARMSQSLYAGSNLKDFDAFAASISSDYFGVPLVIRDLEHAMKRDFYVSTALAILLITASVWRSFRTLPRTLLALSPIALSYAWMLAGMRLLGVNFNFINITISPLLIGLGIESGVTLLFRFDEERALSPDGAMVRAGAASVVAIATSLFTTMLVFATLLWARTPGLRFLGTSALLGLGFSLFFSLVFVPAATSLFSHRAAAKAAAPSDPS